MSEITVSELRSFFGITSDIMSDDEISSILSFVDTVIGVEVPSSVDDDSVKYLELLQFGCITFKTRNPANYLKKGISSWNVGRINVSFAVSDVSTLGETFCAEYKRFLNLNTGGRRRGYAGCTNSGTGLWQTTQKQGPMFIRIGNRDRRTS